MEEAIKVAQRSTHKRYMMGCVIVQRAEIISKGFQHSGTWRMRELFSMHAELHALFNLRHKRGQLSESTVYIAGIARKSGNVVPALPCVCCATALMHAGIYTVRYTSPVITVQSGENYFAETRYATYKIYLPDELENLKTYPAP